ncbi:helix-turn-helix transcriptional regulator [Colwellia demingiae]|uniref:Helix-turn-helix transcriptional regulator n=1 Tax=Colwellia demingiae TaxID=89401 RepID=A0A5C6QM90_9GAMM|nr:helix-turn-helix transcriptional regulator [Colwellia demingiae]TWX69903.1 helix-turn-helix transcriptional regulator [Colwellia demingiae]
MNIIGKNVRLIRERKGWTQEQLAAKCNLIDWGISRSTLAKIESNVRGVTDIEVNYLAVALDIEIEILFLYQDKT